MSVFSTKLDSLHQTLRLALSADASSLSTALSSGIDQLGIAVGSGGSAIAAEYLRVCRRTLGSSPTLVQTPMEFVLGTAALSDAHVYLFSAGGRNPDILAAFDAASVRGAGSVHVVTNTDTSELAQRCSASRGSIFTSCQWQIQRTATWRRTLS
jgi:fructoselysine-6-P-deglycase FrlB-like protein